MLTIQPDTITLTLDNGVRIDVTHLDSVALNDLIEKLV